MTLLHTSTVLAPGSFVVGPLPASSDLAVFKVSGTSLLHAPVCSPAAAEAALKSLRGFRTAGRRVAWCNPAELARVPNADLGAWGRKFVEQGGAEMVVVCGSGGRELAIAARDAGLPIGRVVVCSDDVTARNVLGDSIMSGDAVLALGISAESCYKLAERLESRFERESLVAR
jgi:hypothetical protein